MTSNARAVEGTGSGRAIGYLVGAVALMLAIHAAPAPSPLEHAGAPVALTVGGKACLAILGFAVVLWVTEALPFAVTSLFVLLLLPLLGIADYATVVAAGFGNPIITFFIGVLILSAGFTRSGLGTRLVLHVLLAVGTRTDRVLLAFIGVGALLSMWINNMAVSALLLPLAVGLLSDARRAPLESNFGRALLIGCAYGVSIGGIATPAGTGANPVAIGYLAELADRNVSFLRWMSLGVPVSLLMIPLGWLVLLKVFPPEIERLPIERDDIERQLRDLGPPTSAQVRALVIFVLTIVAWVASPLLAYLTDGRLTLSIHVVALVGGLALFLPAVSVLSWKEAQHDVDWGAIVLIVAGLALGLMVYETGAARWLGLGLLAPLARAPTIIQPFIIVIVVALVHLLFSSNTVTSTVIMPILIALAQDFGLDVWTTAAAAAFTSSLAFVLVTESPANVIPYSAGYFSISDMARTGVWMTLGAAVCVTVALASLGGLAGEF